MFAYDVRFQDKAYGQSMCGKGWHDLIGAVYDEIAAVERDIPDVRIPVIQVKEKFGTLRFYHSAKPINDVAPDPSRAKQAHERVAVAVHAAWEKSSVTCEECGQDGELRTNNTYIQTLCETHKRPDNR